ncbi:MAG: glycerophosphodiester phosphodiesterase family protein [Caldilineales bacterium]
MTLELPGKRRPYLMAHRGNRVACPENTLAAFRQALDDGADIIETDLHVTADGEFVCIHDATVDRTTDGRGPVAGMTLVQLKTLSASCRRVGFEGEGVPTLGEVAALLPADVALAIELKTDRFLWPDVVWRLVKQLTALGVRDRTVVLSFSRARIQAVATVAPDVPIGWITLSTPLPARGPQLLGPFWPLLLLNPLYVALAHRCGQFVAPLDPLPDRRVPLYVRLGCDAVLSDNPAATAAVLRRAGVR